MLISSPSPSATAARADARGPASTGARLCQGRGVPRTSRFQSVVHHPDAVLAVALQGLVYDALHLLKGAPGRLPRAADLST